MLPHKPLYARVVGMCLEAAIQKFVLSWWAPNRDIVDERNGGVWDFRLEDVGNVIVEDRD